eukprot:TRINITY_DN4313_c0_g1_i1.p2 TRINITY_DN4313_c0_g1~~TRINITY_DN4313_c0_g1_i1.p2  ORF type:complete len:133 (-),score=67.63 TRINITY_DN4313_c0_g1_i1:1130-1528(-)
MAEQEHKSKSKNKDKNKDKTQDKEAKKHAQLLKKLSKDIPAAIAEAEAEISFLHPANGAEAWAILQAGNQRFITSDSSATYIAHLFAELEVARRGSLVASQHPIASVLCCSDSRVPPELVFDQGLGTIFCVR